MAEVKHGRFSQSNKVTEFRCRFCGQPATIWFNIPLVEGEKAEVQTLCDNHALKLQRALMDDLEFSKKEGESSAERIMQAQTADQTA